MSFVPRVLPGIVRGSLNWQAECYMPGDYNGACFRIVKYLKLVSTMILLIDLELRLRGGSAPNSGLLEVRNKGNDSWGSVCDDNWNDYKNVEVACRQMNYKWGEVRCTGYIESRKRGCVANIVRHQVLKSQCRLIIYNNESHVYQQKYLGNNAMQQCILWRSINIFHLLKLINPCVLMSRLLT